MSTPQFQDTDSELQIATDSKFTDVVKTLTGKYRTTQSIGYHELPLGQTLYSRVRHKNTSIGDTQWSVPVNFSVLGEANIIGVCFDGPSASASNKWYWVDQFGNQVESFDYHRHSLFQNIKMVTLDADRGSPVTMTRFPRFYIKTATSGPAGTFSNGKKCWWISDIPTDGFRVHPAFKRSTKKGSDGKYKTSEYICLGTYKACKEVVDGKEVLGSKDGTEFIKTGMTIDLCRKYADNRNEISSNSGNYRMMDVYDLGMLRLLNLIMSPENANTEVVWGLGLSEATETGASHACIIFSGSASNKTAYIDDLWGISWEACDKACTNANKLSMTSPMDDTKIIFQSNNPDDYQPTTVRGAFYDVCSCPIPIGDQLHELSECFIPKGISTGGIHMFPDLCIPHDSAIDQYLTYGDWVDPSQEVGGNSGLYATSYMARRDNINNYSVRLAYHI